MCFPHLSHSYNRISSFNIYFSCVYLSIFIRLYIMEYAYSIRYYAHSCTELTKMVKAHFLNYIYLFIKVVLVIGSTHAHYNLLFVLSFLTLPYPQVQHFTMLSTDDFTLASCPTTDILPCLQLSHIITLSSDINRKPQTIASLWFICVCEITHVL